MKGRFKKLMNYQFSVPDIIVMYLKKVKIKKAALYLNIGAYFMRRGVLIVPGQQIVLKKGISPSLRGNRMINRRKDEVVFIDNIFYDFVHNRISPRYTNNRPVWMKTDSAHEKKG